MVIYLIRLFLNLMKTRLPIKTHIAKLKMMIMIQKTPEQTKHLNSQLYVKNIARWWNYWDNSPLLVFSLTEWRTPSRLGHISLMLPMGQCDRGSLCLKWLLQIKSPTQKLRFFCVHLLQRFKDSKYFLFNLFQKTSAVACTDLHFLAIVNLLLMEYSCDCILVTADYKVTWSECF